MSSLAIARFAYDDRVRHWILASVAVLALLASPLVLAATGQAQVPGSQILNQANIPSVTGAVRPMTGAVRPPIGPIQPPTGAVPGPAFEPGAYVADSRVFSGRTSNAEGHHHQDHGDGEGYALIPYAVPYAVAIPYAPDDAAPDQNSTPDDDAGYQGGPTVFDRRGSGADSYVPPVEDALAPHSDQAGDANTPADESPQPQTILVFKDGHKLEIRNYAIVGSTLFDLTPGHARRIALAALDLDATRQQNDDRGVVFQLPASTQGS